MGARNDLAGGRFGRLRVEGPDAKRDRSGNVYWRCACDCGAAVVVAGRSLTRGDVKSCGCWKRSAERSRQRCRDLAGQRFGRLVATDLVGAGRGAARWRCACDCGGERVCRVDSLVCGRTTSCGCYRPERARDERGRRYGRLVVIERAGSRTTRNGSEATWRCRCECGADVTVLGRSLRAGNTRSCGCIGRSAGGLSGTREHRASLEAVRRARKAGRGESFTHQEVIGLHARQKGRCAVCAARVPITKAQRDHVMPLALGGGNSIRNIQLLCRPCNQSKHARHPIEFMQSRGFLL